MCMPGRLWRQSRPSSLLDSELAPLLGFHYPAYLLLALAPQISLLETQEG